MSGDTTVLIQGPLNRTSLDHIDHYLSYGRVLISFWDTDDESLLYDIPSEVELVKRSPPTHKYYQQDTFDYQIWSIYNGLYNVKTPIVIRTRSDEYYGNLDPLIERFNSDRTKIVCGNVFFKKWNAIPFHIGDHLFMGDTELLFSAYKELVSDPQKYVAFGYAELTVAMAILHISNNKSTQDQRKADFIKLFDVVDINTMAPFLVSWNHNSTVYRNHFDLTNSCITTIGDL